MIKVLPWKLTFSAFIAFASLLCFVSAARADVILEAPSTSVIGQPFFITLEVSGEEISDVRVNWQGHEALLAPRQTQEGTKYSALLGSDIKNAKAGAASLRISFNAREREEILHSIKLKARKYPSEKLKVAPTMVIPPKELSQRLDREAKLSRSAIQSNNPGFSPPAPLVRPVPGIFTSVYGKSRYFNGELRSRHGGIDFRAKEGTPVRVAADGTVALTGEKFYFAGNCVYVDHGAGLVSFYGHLSKINVKNGDKVKAGDVIGLSGKTGRITGPHLHFSLSWRGEFLDPESLLPPQ